MKNVQSRFCFYFLSLVSHSVICNSCHNNRKKGEGRHREEKKNVTRNEIGYFKTKVIGNVLNVFRKYAKNRRYFLSLHNIQMTYVFAGKTVMVFEVNYSKCFFNKNTPCKSNIYMQVTETMHNDWLLQLHIYIKMAAIYIRSFVRFWYVLKYMQILTI